MTLEQLVSPAVTEWIDNYNKRLNEGLEYSSSKVMEEFESWFCENEDKINESVKNSEPVEIITEGRFDGAFDDDEEDEDGDGDDSPVDGEIERDEDVTEEDDEDESSKEVTGADPETESEIEDEVSRDPRAKFKVSNTKKNPSKNVFNVVNTLYEKICKDGKNMDKVTYLSMVDVSDVVDMTALLAFTNIPNADLSGWDTGSVRKMEGMFYKSTFNNDSICDWDVGRCNDFKNMFLGSKFTQSLNRWKPAWEKHRERVEDPETGEKRWEEVDRRHPLPFVGGYEDEEKEERAAFWDDKLKDFKGESVKSKYDHILDFKTFMINEGLMDKVKSGIDKVKGMFKTAAVKIGKYLLSFIGEDGEIVPAVSPYTSINYAASGECEGVTAYTNVENSLVDESAMGDAELIQSEETYNVFDKDSDPVAYENYKTFVKELNKKVNEGNTRPFDVLLEEDALNEDRVGFSAKDGGLKGISDVDSTQLKKMIGRVLRSTPGTMGKDALGALLIWGAPGVGKSTIPNAIISEYNATTDMKKALIVAECGDMTPDGFALPMPVKMGFDEYFETMPKAKEAIESLGLTKEQIAKSRITRSDDAPKMWLPCYKPTPDSKANSARKMIANGHVREYYDEKGDYHVEETVDGGIIMFDEFFRADPSIFKILMQILLNRKYGGFTLGDKWGIIACSNRPNDDEEVASTFDRTGAVVTTRVTQVNFVPDFKDWQKWAEREGHFDPLTISFLVQETDSVTGEYTNWHNIDPEKHREGEVAHPTPRSWSAYMKELYNIMKLDGIENISDIDQKDLEIYGNATIGEEMTTKYIDFIKNKKDSVINIDKLFEDPDYMIPSEPLVKAAELSEKVLNYVVAKYSKENPPKVEELLNMFNTINKTYSKGSDNYFKQMHVDILDHLYGVKSIKDYYKKCVERYQVDKVK